MALSANVVTYHRGTQAFISAKIEAFLPNLNAEIAANVISEAPPPVFVTAIGDPEAPAGPTIAVASTSNSPRRIAYNEKIITVAFKILCLIPQSGDNTSSNFEIAKQISMEYMMTTFDDDLQVLTPKIDAGIFGIVQGVEGERGDMVDLWPRYLDDKDTSVHGWQCMYSVGFALQTRP